MSARRRAESPKTTVAQFCDRVVFALCCSMLVVTPFVYQKYMNASVAFRRPKETAFQVLSILIIGVWLARYLDKERSVPRLSSLLCKSPYTWPAILLIVACFASMTNVACYFYFWDTVLSVLCAIALCFILSAVIGKRYKRLLSFVGLISLAGSFMGGYCIIQYYGLDPLFVPRKRGYAGRTISSGFIDNPNTVSGYLVAVLPIVLSIFFVARKKWVRLLSLVGTLAILGGLLSACTRGALIAGLVAGAVFLVLVLLRGRYTEKEKRMIAVGVAIVLAFIAAYLSINPSLLQRIVQIKQVLDLRINTRYIEWCTSKRMMSDHFLVGIGLGNFKHYYLKYRGYAAKDIGFIGRWEKANQAHNEYVQVSAEMGFLGLFAMCWVIGSFLWFVLRNIMRVKRSIPELPELRADLEHRRANLLSGLLCSLLALAGHCAFMFPLHIVPSAVTGIFVLAISYSLAKMPVESMLPASGPPLAAPRLKTETGRRRR